MLGTGVGNVLLRRTSNTKLFPVLREFGYSDPKGQFKSFKDELQLIKHRLSKVSIWPA